jgi:hypothetical protein
LRIKIGRGGGVRDRSGREREEEGGVGGAKKERQEGRG